MNILWDFDGTLFDTYPAYTEILYRVLGKQHERQEIFQQLKVSFGHAFDIYQLNQEQLKEFKSLEGEIQPHQMKPFEGVENVLSFATKNVIMTHKDRKSVNDILAFYKMEKYFVDIVTIDDGYPRKPDSASYKYLHDKHTIDLAIGDRELDLIPAHNLGIKTCSFQRESEIADFTIYDYREFEQVVEGMSLK